MHVDNVQPPVGPGDTVAGKYQVERLIGSGGVGVVFAATHLELGEPVAIKFLLPRAAKNVVDVARFCREAQAAAQLKTEHATRVLETGVLHDGSPYMVMELLEGRDLADLLKLSGPLPIEEALEYVLQASVALAEAHRLGIVHRDIKPSNLFLTHHPDGTPLVKILDFGIAKASVEAQAGVAPQDLTKTSALLGSPLYMSPEQIRSTKSVDARSDIWSLGIVLYELLCGTTPFDAESLTGVVAGIIGSTPPPLGTRRAGLSPDLVAVIDRCLQKNPRRRFLSVAELAVALEPFAPKSAKISVARILHLQSTPPVAASAVPSPIGTSDAPSPTVRTLQSDGSAAPSRPRRRRAIGAAVAVVAPALLALILAVALRDPPASTAPVLPLSAADAKSRAQPAEPSAAPQRFVTTAPAPTAQKDAGPEGASPEAKPPAVASTARGPRTMLVSTKPRQPASATARANKKPAVSLVDETVDTRR